MQEVPLIRPDGLQLDEHRQFQERFWTIERAAWIVFGMIVIAALAGAFGAGGPLATTTTTEAGATIQHPRIARWEAADEMTVQFAADQSEERSVRLSPTFAEAFQVEDIQPLPNRTTIGANGQTLFFAQAPGDTGTVKFHLRAQSPGLARFEIALDGVAHTVSLTSFVFP